MRQLYDHFIKEMLATSFRITNDWHRSEDILQDAFLTTFQKIHQLKDDGKYGSWLKRIVVNNSLQNTRRQMKFEPVETDHLMTSEASDNYDNISMEVFDEAIRSLPDGCRQVFCLYLVEGYKHREIGDLLHISESTSKSQYRYALKLLRQQLIMPS